MRKEHSCITCIFPKDLLKIYLNTCFWKEKEVPLSIVHLVPPPPSPQIYVPVCTYCLDLMYEDCLYIYMHTSDIWSVILLTI